MANKETKIFKGGGLNTDSAIEDIQPNDFIDALNVRVTGTDENEAGYLTNIEQTTKITPIFQRPAGINKNIGATGFKNTKKAYSIYYNSQGKHQITVLDYKTLVEKIIFEDITNTGGIPIFNITPDSYFGDIKLVNEQFLVTTEGTSGIIYCIDVVKLEAGGYGNNIKQDEFNLLKIQPLIPIKAEYASDFGSKSNLLKGKLFQYRYQFVYDNGIKSTWSTISERPVPNDELSITGDSPTNLNAIILELDAGNTLVKELNIAVRVGNFDWYLIKNIKTTEVLAITNLSINLAGDIKEAYSPINNKYYFTFYNDAAGEALSPLDTDEPYDAIPKNAGALEVVNGNIVVLADLQEGYPRPSIKVLTTSSNYKAKINSSVASTRSEDFFVTLSSEQRIKNNTERYQQYLFKGVPRLGDKLTIKLKNRQTDTVTNEYTHTALTTDDFNLENFVNSIYNKMPFNPTSGYDKNKFKSYPNEDDWILGFVTQEDEIHKEIELILNRGGVAQGTSLNILKSGSSYQLALAHYDKFGRYFPITTSKDYVVKTDSFVMTEGLSPQIGWTIEGEPPTGATSYQWLITENTKYLNNLYVTGVYDEDESKGDFISFDLKALGDYISQNKANNIAYDFADGDRVSIISSFTKALPEMKWFNGKPNNPPNLDFAVVSYEIKAKTVTGVTTTKYLLKIKKSGLININTDIKDKEIVLEIYTPKKNNSDLYSKVFYEIGQQFNIINGEYSNKFGSITKGDAYIRPRKYISNITGITDVFAIPVEDFNFSDNYESNFWSKGRGRTYNDEVGEVRRKGCFRYSDTFNLGSLNNNINRFYANRIYGDQPSETTSLNGAIVKMVLRAQYLIILQEIAVAHVPVFTSILEDQAENQNVAISNKLFNNVRYITNGLGAGLSKKAISVSSNEVVYFVDPNNGYPCRDGLDGVKIINYNNEKYFIETIKGADPRELIGYYDDYNSEWNLTFNGLVNQLAIFTFKDVNWESKDVYTKLVDNVTIVQPSHGVVTKVLGDLIYTPTTSYVGNDGFSINFIDGGETISKNACINVKFGVVEIQPYSFTSQLAVPLSTYIESNSNTLVGATVPVPISIVGGQYSVNGGAFTSSAGTIPVGASFKVRIMSSATNVASSSATLTISNVSATFQIKTLALGQVFKNARKTATRTKDNCGADKVGTDVTLVVPAETVAHNSTVSQVDADNKAQAYADANAQSNANTYGTCSTPQLYSNSYQSKLFQKQGCGGATEGTWYLEERLSGSVSGYSLATANANALAQIDANGQTNANTYGTCENLSTIKKFTFKVTVRSTYPNIKFDSSDIRGVSFEFRNGANYYKIFAAKFVPTTITNNGVEYSFAIALSGVTQELNNIRCYIVTNAAIPSTVSVNNSIYHNTVLVGSNVTSIPATPSGSKYVLDVPVSTATTLSETSVIELFLGEIPPSTTYYSVAKSATATRTNCPPENIAGSATYTTIYGDFTSLISQVDADNKAQTFANGYAETYANSGAASCTPAITFPNDEVFDFFKSTNCTYPAIAEFYKYTVASGTYYATTVNDANAQAYADIASNGQNQANIYGVCTSPTYFTFKVRMYNTYTEAEYSPVDSRGKSFDFINGDFGATNIFSSLLVNTTITNTGIEYTFNVGFSGANVTLNRIKCYLALTVDKPNTTTVYEKIYLNGNLVSAFDTIEVPSGFVGDKYNHVVRTESNITLNSSSILILEHS